MRLRLDTSQITDWPSFHSEFARLFGFPNFYGRNMDAWIDCMTHLNDPPAGMTRIHTPNDEPLLLEITATEDFRHRCPEQFKALVDCTAAVNQRLIAAGNLPILCLVPL